LKEFYNDSVNFDIKALRFALDFAGENQFVAGSDYSHKIGSLEMMVSSIEKLDIPEETKAKIYSKNASRLLVL
jgi:predicted TIM-barrel fold metal-dependent hydrolase